jgi:hypothetical protein
LRVNWFWRNASPLSLGLKSEPSKKPADTKTLHSHHTENLSSHTGRYIFPFLGISVLLSSCTTGSFSRRAQLHEVSQSDSSLTFSDPQSTILVLYYLNLWFFSVQCSYPLLPKQTLNEGFTVLRVVFSVERLSEGLPHIAHPVEQKTHTLSVHDQTQSKIGNPHTQTNHKHWSSFPEIEQTWNLRDFWGEHSIDLIQFLPS